MSIPAASKILPEAPALHHHHGKQDFKVVIFDLDDTLIHEGFSAENTPLCKDTLKVLDYLKHREYKLAIASHNDNSLLYLQSVKICHYFDFVSGEDHYNNLKPSKIANLSAVLDYFDVKSGNCYYFDDVEAHVLEAKELGMNAYSVDWMVGISYEQVCEIL